MSAGEKEASSSRHILTLILTALLARLRSNKLRIRLVPKAVGVICPDLFDVDIPRVILIWSYLPTSTRKLPSAKTNVTYHMSRVVPEKVVRVTHLANATHLFYYVVHTAAQLPDLGKIFLICFRNRHRRNRVR